MKRKHTLKQQRADFRLFCEYGARNDILKKDLAVMLDITKENFSQYKNGTKQCNYKVMLLIGGYIEIERLIKNNNMLGE